MVANIYIMDKIKRQSEVMKMPKWLAVFLAIGLVVVIILLVISLVTPTVVEVAPPERSPWF